ncbi:MAG: tubulin-like doman-containing protein [Clostridiales bacterium]|jgi:hypothetical protein|nr:tubulin-like doman-containing protein [Clostridiales bacterium]
MTCYLLPIGGTGIRVMRALAHLCGAGCFSGVDFRVMCVDSDGVNGDKNRLMETLNQYRAVQRGAPHLLPDIVPCGANGVWSPLNVITQSMSQMVSAGLMSGEGRAVFEFLFSQPERETILEGGVYGRTSIGSYFISQQILTPMNQFTAEWADFFGAPDAGRDKVFIIGSMFGGTGASGIPTIARILKSMPLTADLPIGAAFVMPYFRPAPSTDDSRTDLPIDWRTFNAKAKTALSFYIDQNLDDIFQVMYFIGEQEDNFMWVENHVNGAAQRNKAHIVEAHAAAFLKDFLKMPGDGAFHVRFYGLGEESETPPVGPELINNVVTDTRIFDRLMDFFFFASFYTKYAYPSIRAGESQCVMGWLRRLTHDCGLGDEESAALNDYCQSYLTWMLEMMVLTDSHGAIQWDRNNPGVAWLRTDGDYAQLFDGKELDCRVKGIKRMRHYDWEYLRAFADVVKNETRARNTGEDIAVVLSGKRFVPNGGQTRLECWIEAALELCGRRKE